MQYEGSEHVAFTRPAPSIMPTDMAKRCSNCNSDLSADDLDLKSVVEYFNQEEAQRYWEEGAANGCLFCRLIASVWADAGQQYRCYRSGYVKIGLTTDGQYFLHLVNILSKLPHTVHRGVYATIAIYLEGKASPFDRYVLPNQHRRFWSSHSLREIQADPSASHRCCVPEFGKTMVVDLSEWASAVR
jgi:hypothetical protein